MSAEEDEAGVRAEEFEDSSLERTDLPIVDIPLERIRENRWNPNVETDETFNQLVQEIEEDGFDQPILVVPNENLSDEEMDNARDEGYDEEDFTIVGGEHRYKACRVLGYEKIPAIIKDQWTDVDQKLKTVRRNQLSGELDKTEFSALVEDVKQELDDQPSDFELAQLFAFDDEDGFLQKYEQEVMEDGEFDDGEIGDVMDDMMEETEQEMEMVDNLSAVVNEIMTQYGNTVQQSFVFFAYGGTMHLMVGMDNELREKIVEISEDFRVSDSDLAEFFNNVLEGAEYEQYLPEKGSPEEED